MTARPFRRQGTDVERWQAEGTHGSLDATSLKLPRRDVPPASSRFRARRCELSEPSEPPHQRREGPRRSCSHQNTPRRRPFAGGRRRRVSPLPACRLGLVASRERETAVPDLEPDGQPSTSVGNLPTSSKRGFRPTFRTLDAPNNVTAVYPSDTKTAWLGPLYNMRIPALSAFVMISLALASPPPVLIGPIPETLPNCAVCRSPGGNMELQLNLATIPREHAGPTALRNCATLLQPRIASANAPRSSRLYRAVAGQAVSNTRCSLPPLSARTTPLVLPFFFVLVVTPISGKY